METLENVAAAYADNVYDFKERPFTTHKEAFKAGAEWQKERDKELINLARQLIIAYDLRHPDTNQLLAGYTNEEALLKFNTLYGDFLNA